MENRGVAEKTAGVVAVVAGLIAAVKPAPGDPRELQKEPTGSIHHSGLDYDWPPGRRGQQSEATIAVTMRN